MSEVLVIRYGRWFAKLTLVAILFSMATTVYWLYLEEHMSPVDEYLSTTYMSSESGGEARFIFRPGDTVFVNWHLLINKRCPASFTRFFVNNHNRSTIVLVDHEGAAPDAEPGEPVKWAEEIVLPISMVGGAHEYRVRGTFDCNPIKPQVVDYDPIPFRIIGEPR